VCLGHGDYRSGLTTFLHPLCEALLAECEDALIRALLEEALDNNHRQDGGLLREE
jgi:hypothetical protein